MKNKKIITILLIISLLLICKVIFILNYKINNNDINKLKKIKAGLIINDLLVITKKESSDYLEYKGMKIKNIFQDYECSKNSKEIKCIKDSNTSFSMGLGTSYLDKFKKYKIKKYNTSEIIKNKKIVGDIDLFGNIKEADTKKTFLNTIKDCKEDYILNKFALSNIKDIDSLDLIEGSYSGILIHSGKNRSLYIYKDEKTYLFKFNNTDVFTNKLLEELMNSIEI